MPFGFKLDKGGRWRGPGGRFAKIQDVENAFIRAAGFFQDKAGRWRETGSGRFAKKSDVEIGKQAGVIDMGIALENNKNERINVMEWNKIKNNPEDYRGFLNWTKESWTGRNRGNDRTQAILDATNSRNISEAYKKYKTSKAGLLYESIKNIDAATLIKEFSSFLNTDMQAYIQYLRKLGIGSQELYDEAKAQQMAYIAKYGM